MKNAGTVLIADVNKGLLTALTLLIKKTFNNVISIQDTSNILEVIKEHSVDVVLLDMGQKSAEERRSSLAIIREIIGLEQEIQIVVITAFSDNILAADAIAAGAFDYIVKPWNNDKLAVTLANAYKLKQYKLAVNQITAIKEALITGSNFFWGISNSMKQLYSVVHKAAQTDNSVWIKGVSGCGKGLLAKEIHSLSKRKSNLFISINAKEINDSDFEKELLGYKKDAILNAISDKAGKLKLAYGGSLYIKDIDKLSPDNQKLLLNILNTKKYNVLGDTNYSNTDFRIICSSTQNVEELANQGKFNKDLFKMLSSVKLTMPSLNERKEDILPMATLFLNRYCSRYNKNISGFSELTKEILVSYNWKGNVKELSLAVERAVMLSDDDYIDPGYILLSTYSEDSNVMSSNIPTIEQMEIKLIRKAIKKAKGNMSLAADILGVTRQTLYNKGKKHKLFL